MPQVVSSVCAGGSDRKISCETLADDNNNEDSTHDPKIRPVSIDFPPESYSLSKEEQLEWLNDNAFFERKESQKRNSPTPNQNPNPNSNSQRVSLKSKASIIRLPKPQKTCFNEAKKRRNCRIARTLMIPKRIGSRLKSDPSLSEPSSPKVSCIGRVRSKRDRSRRIQRQKSGSFKDKPVRVKKPGFFTSFRAIFRTGGGCKDVSTAAREAHAPRKDAVVPTPARVSARRSTDIRGRLPPEESSPTRNSTGSRRSLDCGGDEPVLPGLGGMTRFTSGRRPDLLVDVA
ncbi:PREDICTED: uncharacterized protein LOC104711820 [Camelina sativa]|uniref:Uncharacterized protein LOC104711820 n=1 Tax=Camelina sativa TaxID=90675 RepID=A0ABM0TIG7_CAMSA|nr:PREDICTED: uncharacterized protein LOC104711820 [Camelina sativa]